MTATTTTPAESNVQQRKTLASQLDRLEGILDGLDTALAGAVQEAVEQAVKQAVRAVLTEVLTNRELQEQLHQAAPPASAPEQSCSKRNGCNRLWQITSEGLRRTVQKMKKLGRGAVMAVMAAGGVVVGLVYAARKQIASVAAAVYHSGRRLLGRAMSALTGILPSFALGGT